MHYSKTPSPLLKERSSNSFACRWVRTQHQHKNMGERGGEKLVFFFLSKENILYIRLSDTLTVTPRPDSRAWCYESVASVIFPDGRQVSLCMSPSSVSHKWDAKKNISTRRMIDHQHWLFKSLLALLWVSRVQSMSGRDRAVWKRIMIASSKRRDSSQTRAERGGGKRIFLGLHMCVCVWVMWAEQGGTFFPTNNALLINFWLSSDAKFLLISQDSACESAPNMQKTCMQRVHILS